MSDLPAIKYLDALAMVKRDPAALEAFRGLGRG